MASSAGFAEFAGSYFDMPTLFAKFAENLPQFPQISAESAGFAGTDF